MPAEKKHIGSWALPGAASTQSLESTTSAAWPIVSASVAAVMDGGALIWDANLGFGPCAAQEFRFVDDGDGEGFGPLELRPRVRTDHQGRGFLRDAVGHVPARGLDQLGRL